MHKNRSLPLDVYQQKLEERVNKLAFLLCNKETENFYIFKPQIKSMFHPEMMKSYLEKRSNMLYKKLSSSRHRMLTLTYSTRLYTPEQVASRHKRDLKKFWRELRKLYKGVQYCYFVEVTLQNYVHFHIYFQDYLDVAKVQRIWKEITGSYIVKIKLVETEQQIRYCSDYHQVAKKFAHYQLEFAFKNISRFFGQSRHFFEKKEEIESLYEWIGKISYKGHNLLKLLELENFNESVMFEISNLNALVENIVFHIELDGASQKFACIGKTYKQKILLELEE